MIKSPRILRGSQPAIEDYLKTILDLARTASPVSTSRIAQARQVRPASVTGMMRKLSDEGYVNYQKHRGVTLTEQGRSLALEILRHHRLIELYLTREPGFCWDEVHEQAEVLEHFISEKLEARIAEVLNHPTIDPHGEPIPALDGMMTLFNTMSLASIAAGEQVTVARVADDSDGELLRYLASLGIFIGAEVEVLEIAPIDGPLTILLDNEAVVIGRKVSNLIYVTS